ncbi:MAG: MgtC/SapB family protein [Burkholderiales bacterium]
MDALPKFLEELHIPLQFMTSLAIGLLLGLERQRNPIAKAGLRTCALVALFGTICGLLAQTTANTWIVAAGLLVTGAMIIAAYVGETLPEGESGTTTVIAVMLCYVLGAMVWYGYTQHAVGLAIVATVLLHFKTELHGFSDKLAPGDVSSMLQFAVLTFIVLPLLPNRGYGPYQAFNPYHLWLMVVLISGVSLIGYLALRFTGAKRGLTLIGALGGLVSSTATTLVYARHSAMRPDMTRFAAAVIMIANLTVLLRLAVIASIASPDALPKLLPVLAAGMACGLLPVRWQSRAVVDGSGVTLPEMKNPTQLRVAAGFGLLYAAVLLGAAWLSQVWGSSGLYALAAASGIADVDAISLSILQLFNTGKIEARTVVIAIVVAYVSSVIFKFAITRVVGGADLARRCVPAFLASTAGLLLGLVFL